jgi:hypothetical protein
MRHSDLTTAIRGIPSASWILAYATVDVPLKDALTSICQSNPGVPVFGCTSFLGVFEPTGFTRGLQVLAATTEDSVRAVPAIRAAGAARARTEARAAAAELQRTLGKTMCSILMHATPGFEERVLEGISDAFDGSPPPVYGGSAADDDMSGKWKVFSGSIALSEGILLVGFASSQRVIGSFVGGYTPTNTRGIVTSATGRLVHTIDGKPAAQVYNDWTYGGIKDQLGGGIVLHETALRPLGRVVDKVGAVPRYLLSHPHQVMPDGTLLFFSEMKQGDELVLMLGTEDALRERTNQVTDRALASVSELRPLAGGVLVFCGGCVGALQGKVDGVASSFRQQLGNAPFIGAATFGEQGCFTGRTALNRHGNLMCDALFFES